MGRLRLGYHTSANRRDIVWIIRKQADAGRATQDRHHFPFSRGRQRPANCDNPDRLRIERIQPRRNSEYIPVAIPAYSPGLSHDWPEIVECRGSGRRRGGCRQGWGDGQRWGFRGRSGTNVLCHFQKNFIVKWQYLPGGQFQNRARDKGCSFGGRWKGSIGSGWNQRHGRRRRFAWCGHDRRCFGGPGWLRRGFLRQGEAGQRDKQQTQQQ